MPSQKEISEPFQPFWHAALPVAVLGVRPSGQVAVVQSGHVPNHCRAFAAAVFERQLRRGYMALQQDAAITGTAPHGAAAGGASGE